MSQMFSQMSQIGDELDEDAAFGDFASAWDSHTASTADPARQEHSDAVAVSVQGDGGNASVFFLSKVAGGVAPGDATGGVLLNVCMRAHASQCVSVPQ